MPSYDKGLLLPVTEDRVNVFVSLSVAHAVCAIVSTVARVRMRWNVCVIIFISVRKTSRYKIFIITIVHS